MHDIVMTLIALQKSIPKLFPMSTSQLDTYAKFLEELW